MPPKRVSRSNRGASASSITSTKGRKVVTRGKKSSSGFSHDQQIVGLIYANDYDIVKSVPDGNCLFRSLSTCFTRSETHHVAFRELAVSEIQRAVQKALKFQQDNNITSKDDGLSDDDALGGPRTRGAKRAMTKKFSSNSLPITTDDIDSKLYVPDYHYFVPGEFFKYCHKMSTPSVWGGHLEIQAIANIFGITIIVLQDRFPPVTVNPELALWPETSIILHLLYRGQCHYDAILPGDERIAHFQHNTATLSALKSTITQRHKATTRIPFDLSYLEPMTKTFWLSQTAKEQCQMGVTKGNQLIKDEDYDYDLDYNDDEDNHQTPEKQDENDRSNPNSHVCPDHSDNVPCDIHADDTCCIAPSLKFVFKKRIEKDVDDLTHLFDKMDITPDNSSTFDAFLTQNGNDMNDDDNDDLFNEHAKLTIPQLKQQLDSLNIAYPKSGFLKKDYIELLISSRSQNNASFKKNDHNEGSDDDDIIPSIHFIWDKSAPKKKQSKKEKKDDKKSRKKVATTKKPQKSKPT